MRDGQLFHSFLIYVKHSFYGVMNFIVVGVIFFIDFEALTYIFIWYKQSRIYLSIEQLYKSLNFEISCPLDSSF